VSNKLKIVLLAAFVLFVVVAAINAAPTTQAAPPAQLPTGDAKRGEYVFALAEGCGCHSEGEAGFLAGGFKFEGPFGVVYSRNITSDTETGIGGETDQQIADAIRLGKEESGEQLFPIMPYHVFSGMADQDVADLIAYLRTVPPIKNQVPERQLNFPVPPFTPSKVPPATAPTAGVARGEYLVNNVSQCNDCHGGTTATGDPDPAKFLGGNAEAPNITPGNEKGVGAWSLPEIATILQTGVRPDGTEVGGLMKTVIEFGFHKMTTLDALAIAEYLKTVPAVPVEAPQQQPQQLPSTGGQPYSTEMFATMLLAGMVLIVGGLVLVRRRSH
jgi:mono/diheme cytochrome c family protein